MRRIWSHILKIKVDDVISKAGKFNMPGKFKYWLRKTSGAPN